MNKVKVEVPENAKGWIDRYQEKDAVVSDKAGIYRIIEFVVNSWSEELLTDNEAKDMLITLNNAGIIIEEPAFLGNESGRKNLELLYMLRHKRDKKRIADVMQMLGLNSESKKTVRQYSLGMRQRLALAQALMEDPDILILDEPMNGLDRDGVNEIRQLLLKLKEQGKTILLASHNKEDIEVLCDEVFEMEHGKLQRIR